MNAIHACEAGANRVHLLSGEFQGSVLQEVFSARGDGTMVYANQYSSIRPATIEDIPDILRIMQDYIAKGYLVPRTQDSISEKLDDYVVYSIDNSIHGCGALHAFEDGMAEVARCELPQVGHRRSDCASLDFSWTHEGLQEAVLAYDTGSRLVLPARI